MGIYGYDGYDNNRGLWRAGGYSRSLFLVEVAGAKKNRSPLRHVSVTLLDFLMRLVGKTVTDGSIAP